MASKRIAGVAYVKWNGRQLPLRGGWTVSIDAYEREGIAGQDGVHGYKEMPRVPFMEGDISLDPEVSITELANIRSATITAELANGKTYILRDAWTADARELDSEEGKTKIKFEGMSGREL